MWAPIRRWRANSAPTTGDGYVERSWLGIVPTVEDADSPTRRRPGRRGCAEGPLKSGLTPAGAALGGRIKSSKNLDNNLLCGTHSCRTHTVCNVETRVGRRPLGPRAEPQTYPSEEKGLCGWSRIQPSCATTRRRRRARARHWPGFAYWT